MSPWGDFSHILLSLNLDIKSTYTENTVKRSFPSVSSCSCHIRRQIRDPKTADGKVGPSRHRISGTGNLPVSKFSVHRATESGTILADKRFPKTNVLERRVSMSFFFRNGDILGGVSAEVGVNHGLLLMLRGPSTSQRYHRRAGKLSSKRHICRVVSLIAGKMRKSIPRFSVPYPLIGIAPFTC